MPEKFSPPDQEGGRGPQLRIEPLAARHLDQVIAIEQASFSQPWRRQLFEAEIVFPKALCLAALLSPGHILVGYLIMWVVVDEAQIQNIAVHPAFRGLGVGRSLLERGLGQARERGATWASLEVRPSNLAARRLYASLGFVEQGRRPRYYQPEGEDALLLNLRLDYRQPA